ncbi:hypothetical protein QQF64_023885 [Cirrhinus molitorella]|uniref:Uncharacterized protein n=1 Tax=Cirrhinus molitorella TaxID=172907 RepID=A0ABR3NK98_9TELE
MVTGSENAQKTSKIKKQTGARKTESRKEGSRHHGDRLRPVAYFSSKLDPVAAGLPHCLTAVASAEKPIMAFREFVGEFQLKNLPLNNKTITSLSVLTPCLIQCNSVCGAFTALGEALSNVVLPEEVGQLEEKVRGYQIDLDMVPHA